MGGETFTTTYTFPSAGTYIMSVEVAEAAAASLNGDSVSSVPGHFTTPYLVDLREAQ